MGLLSWLGFRTHQPAPAPAPPAPESDAAPGSYVDAQPAPILLTHPVDVPPGSTTNGNTERSSTSMAADQKLTDLVSDLTTKEDALQTASSANDQAQADAQSAVAQASAALAAKNTAHDDLSTSIDNLVSYVEGLKGPAAPAPSAS